MVVQFDLQFLNWWERPLSIRRCIACPCQRYYGSSACSTQSHWILMDQEIAITVAQPTQSSCLSLHALHGAAMVAENWRRSADVDGNDVTFFLLTLCRPPISCTEQTTRKLFPAADRPCSRWLVFAGGILHPILWLPRLCFLKHFIN